MERVLIAAVETIILLPIFQLFVINALAREGLGLVADARTSDEPSWTTWTSLVLSLLSLATL